jgi:ubiquitin-large subunit ribosomal protein L40e
MGKFPIADAEIIKIWICKKRKSRNYAGAPKCRKCGSVYLRPKKKNIKAKKAAGT